MKHGYITLVLAVLLAACGTNPAVSGLVSLDEALDNAIQDIESRLPKGTPIVVTAITAPQHETREFLGEELSSRFKNLDTLAREAALSAVEREQDFQMSGLVSDESAVGIGHFIGAKAVISGDMKPFADFTQLRLRVVDVETSKAFVYSARINNKDRLLVNIMPPAAAASRTPSTKVSDNALAHLNRGNDLIAEKKYDEAIQEFSQAIAINGKLAEAYHGRGLSYDWKGDDDRALEDYNEAIRLKPRYAEAYNNRGYLYYAIGLTEATAAYDATGGKLDSSTGNIARAISDITNAIRFNPNYAEAYVNRGGIYGNIGARNKDKGYFDLAIADYNQAIRINPNYEYAYYSRAFEFVNKSDYDRAFADINQAIRLNPNFAHSYSFRGRLYKGKGDRESAIADYNQAIRLLSIMIQTNPNSANYYSRALAYEEIGDIDRAIADYESAMRLGYDFLQSTIDRLRQQQRR